jgi:membrane protein implicated in regulation of membrane protease activity
MDGKIRSHGEAIFRAIVTGAAIVVAWNAPYAWYWQIAIFVVIMFVVGMIYLPIQKAIAKRSSR